MSDSSTVWFPSMVDRWLGVILALLPLISLGVLAASLTGDDPADLVAAIVSCVFTAAIYGLLVFPMRYGIARDELIIRFGVVRQRIPLEAIQEVVPTHNPLSPPALSLDRLAVRTGTSLFSETMISPADREDFLSTLATYSGLKRDGDRLVRVADKRGTRPSGLA
ncbi:MAG: PH domain-containing protein [Desulfobacterales bacterium]|nr:PH domain-containing protein [Desulfobacterales bacterium]